MLCLKHEIPDRPFSPHNSTRRGACTGYQSERKLWHPTATRAVRCLRIHPSRAPVSWAIGLDLRREFRPCAGGGFHALRGMPVRLHHAEFTIGMTLPEKFADFAWPISQVPLCVVNSHAPE